MLALPESLTHAGCVGQELHFRRPTGEDVALKTGGDVNNERIDARIHARVDLGRDDHGRLNELRREKCGCYSLGKS